MEKVHKINHVPAQKMTVADPATNQFPVFSILPEGQENAVSSQYLADLLGFSSVRELQRQIELERQNSAVILSTCRDGGGYFRPGQNGLRETREFIQTLTARSKKTMAAMDSAKAYIRKVGDVDG